jgi:hypothetical protein
MYRRLALSYSCFEIVTQSCRSVGAARADEKGPATSVSATAPAQAARSMSAIGFGRFMRAPEPHGPGSRAGARSSHAQFFQMPTASVTHFLVKLSFAAPANFFSAAVLSQAAFASVSHFFMKLVIAAPASFLLPASTLHDAAYALPQLIKNAVTKTSAFMSSSCLTPQNYATTNLDITLTSLPGFQFGCRERAQALMHRSKVHPRAGDWCFHFALYCRFRTIDPDLAN